MKHIKRYFILGLALAFLTSLAFAEVRVNGSTGTGGASALTDLSDVDAGVGTVNGELLYYDLSNAVWKSTGSGVYYDVTNSYFKLNDVLYFNSPTEEATVTATLNGIGNIDYSVIYRVTYYDADGYEWYAGTGSVACTAHQVRLTNIPVASDSRVVGRKIYRNTGDSDPMYFALVTTIADNSTTTYDDNLAAGSLGATMTVPRPIFMVGDSIYAGADFFTTYFGYYDGDLPQSTWGTYYGVQAGESLTHGRNNTYIGRQAGYSSDISIGSVGIGYRAGWDTNDVTECVFIGGEAGNKSSGDYNVFIGADAGERCDGTDNIAMGDHSMDDHQGEHNIYLGDDAGGGYSDGNPITTNYTIGLGDRVAHYTESDYSIFLGNHAGAFGFSDDDYALGIGDCDNAINDDAWPLIVGHHGATRDFTVTGTTTIQSLAAEKVTNPNMDVDSFTIGGAGTGWTSVTSSNRSYYIHTAGNADTLEQDVSAVNGETYAVVWTVRDRTAGSLKVTVGGVDGSTVSADSTTREYITATGTGNLIFTPSSDFDGKVDYASVRKVDGGDLTVRGDITASGDVAAATATIAGNTTLTGATASRLVATDASKVLTSTTAASWVDGTANQITVADDGDGTITASLPSAVTLPGTLTAGGNVSLGAYYLSNDGTNDGVSIDGNNDVVVDGALTLRDLGSEKVTNPDMDADSFTAGTNWAYNADGDYYEHTAGNTAVLEQDVSAVASEVYYVGFTIANRTAGTVTPKVGNVTGTARSTDGTYYENITATNTNNLQFTPSSDFDGRITFASVRKITADNLTLTNGELDLTGTDTNKILLPLGTGGLYFGDGDTGFRQASDNKIYFRSNGFDYVEFGIEGQIEDKYGDLRISKGYSTSSSPKYANRIDINSGYGWPGYGTQDEGFLCTTVDGYEATRWRHDMTGDVDIDLYGDTLVADLSAEMVTDPDMESSDDWTNTNWTHSTTYDYFSHDTGNIDALTQDCSVSGSTLYVVVWEVDNYVAGSVKVTLGSVDGTTASADKRYTDYITTSDTGNLEFTPSSDFDGDITYASVREVGDADLTTIGTISGLEAADTDLDDDEVMVTAITDTQDGTVTVINNTGGEIGRFLICNGSIWEDADPSSAFAAAFGDEGGDICVYFDSNVLKIANESGDSNLEIRVRFDEVK